MPLTVNPALLLRVAVSDALKMAGEHGLAEAIGEVAGWIEGVAMPAVVRANIAGEDLAMGDFVFRAADGMFYRPGPPDHPIEVATHLVGERAGRGKSARVARTRGWDVTRTTPLDDMREMLERTRAGMLATMPGPMTYGVATDGPASPGAVMVRGEDGWYRRYVRSDGTTEPPSTWLRDSLATVGPAIALRSGPPREPQQQPDHDQEEDRDPDDAQYLGGLRRDVDPHPSQAKDRDHGQGTDDDHGGRDVEQGIAAPTDDDLGERGE